VSALPQHDERVTCACCRFSYPEVRGFCPMCGTAVPAPGEVLGPRPVEGKGTATRTYKLPAFLKRRARIPILIALVLLIISCGLVYLHTRNATPPAMISPAPAITAATSPEVVPPKPVAPEAEAAPSNPVAQKPAVSATPASAPLQPTKDPTELWNRVRKGDSDAEVALAELYLNGQGLPQNCEQAHLLLLAAAKKRNRTADQILSSSYPQRCP
jgi:hypothetical protein